MAVSNSCEQFFVERFSAYKQNGVLPKVYIRKSCLAHKVLLLYICKKKNSDAIPDAILTNEIFKLLSSWLPWTDAQKKEFLANLLDDSHHLVEAYTNLYCEFWCMDVPLMPPCIDQQKLRLEFQIDEARANWILLKLEA